MSFTLSTTYINHQPPQLLSTTTAPTLSTVHSGVIFRHPLPPMQSLHDTHVKLLAFDILSLIPSSSHPNTVIRKGTHILSRAETLDIVTFWEHKSDRFLKFTIDDGTGCIPCVIWLNQLTSPYFSRQCPPDVRRIAEVAKSFATVVQIGVLVRVRGKVGVYRGNVQLTVADVVVERDPNAEIVHEGGRSESISTKVGFDEGGGGGF
ncbi:putative replication factor A protein [Helianthus annuus]|nr:putative replication factor A protein [Helianthus annuus]